MHLSRELVIPDLSGKSVLITGASTGIGAALSRAFAAQGAKVAINFHASEAAAKSLLADIQSAGGEATSVRGDVTKPSDCVGAYLFLASECLSGYIIGQIIEVNGGQLMR